MKYLKKFDTEEKMIAWQKSKDFASPNLVLVNNKINYNVQSLSGVFIEHIDGTLYRPNTWQDIGFANEKANGIAVIDERASFVVAKNALDNRFAWSSETDTLIDGVTTTNNSEEAKLDYNGYENTLKIGETDTIGAAYTCLNYLFPNGNTGYLPSVGEWYVLFDYIDDYISAVNLLGEAFADNGQIYWLSTQISEYQIWAYETYVNKLIVKLKSNYYYILPFTKLKLQ